MKQGSVHALRQALATWTLDALAPDERDWLHRAIERTDDRQASELAFGLAPRKLGKQLLTLSDEALAQAQGLLPGWCPQRLRIDEAARVLLAAERSDLDPLALERLIRHADVDEQCALYKGLPLYAPSLDLTSIVGLGLRTHVTPVFEAIAHDNPWPAAHVDEHRWNHLILKALFMEVSLAPIVGFERRCNPTLSRMAIDYAAERRAAGRAIPDELWRCVEPDHATAFHANRAA